MYEYRQSDLYRAIAYQRGIHYLAMEYEGKRYALKYVQEHEENTYSGKMYYLTLECHEEDDTLECYTYKFQYLSELVKPTDEYSKKKNRNVRILLYNRYERKPKVFTFFNLYPRDSFPGCSGGGDVYNDGNLAVLKLRPQGWW